MLQAFGKIKRCKTPVLFQEFYKMTFFEDLRELAKFYNLSKLILDVECNKKFLLYYNFPGILAYTSELPVANELVYQPVN